MSDMAENTQIADSPSRRANGTRLIVVLVGVLLLVLGLNHFVGQERSGGQVSPGDADGLTTDATRGVTLVRQVGEATNEVIVAANQETTVLDAMQIAASASDEWQFDYEVSGGLAFLTQLGGQANEGSSGKNWLYEVNGKLADMSFGVQPVKQGDRVLWKFAPSE